LGDENEQLRAITRSTAHTYTSKPL
jgi:hypothetical protein